MRKQQLNNNHPSPQLPTYPEAAIDRLNEILRGYPDDNRQRAEIER